MPTWKSKVAVGCLWLLFGLPILYFIYVGFIFLGHAFTGDDIFFSANFGLGMWLLAAIPTVILYPLTSSLLRDGNRKIYILFLTLFGFILLGNIAASGFIGYMFPAPSDEHALWRLWELVRGPAILGIVVFLAIDFPAYFFRKGYANVADSNLYPPTNI